MQGPDLGSQIGTFSNHDFADCTEITKCGVVREIEQCLQNLRENKLSKNKRLAPQGKRVVLVTAAAQQCSPPGGGCRHEGETKVAATIPCR